MDDKLLITNEMLKSALVKEYKNFVDSVDTSEVVDLLIQEQIITIEEGIKCRKKDSRQEGCRFLLDKIFTTNNPTSCIVLCDALKELYPWIYESILKTVNSHGLFFFQFWGCIQFYKKIFKFQLVILKTKLTTKNLVFCY